MSQLKWKRDTILYSSIRHSVSELRLKSKYGGIQEPITTVTGSSGFSTDDQDWDSVLGVVFIRTYTYLMYCHILVS